MVEFCHNGDCSVLWVTPVCSAFTGYLVLLARVKIYLYIDSPKLRKYVREIGLIHINVNGVG